MVALPQSIGQFVILCDDRSLGRVGQASVLDGPRGVSAQEAGLQLRAETDVVGERDECTEFVDVRVDSAELANGRAIARDCEAQHLVGLGPRDDLTLVDAVLGLTVANSQHVGRASVCAQVAALALSDELDHGVVWDGPEEARARGKWAWALAQFLCRV